MFGFATLDLYKAIQEILKDKINSFFAAFFDDGFISAATEDCITAFNYYKNEGPKCGLKVNFNKGKTVVVLGLCKNDD